MKNPVRMRIAGLGLLAAAIAAGLIFLPVEKLIIDLLQCARGQGIWGNVLLGGLYVVACVFFAPGWILTMGAGVLFGVIWGSLTVSIASVLGATAAFLVGRYLARGWIEQKVESHRKFHAIDRAVGRQGFKIVLLTRLSPVFPFNLLNYAFGLTKVSLRDYVLASWIGMFPGTVMYVYLGTVAGSLAELAATKEKGSTGQQVLLAVGLVVTIVVTVFITRLARRALSEATADA